MWIYAHPDWPEFTREIENLSFRLADIRYSLLYI